MSLTPEQQQELAAFPPALRKLVEEELAAGNSVVEIGHSFPAPPAGAYFKLANKVTTRPRASAHGLDFRERNSSCSSGEFTDAKRFYFLVEPPGPPPPEPDMDAIREALEPTADRLSHLAQTRESRTGLAKRKKSSSPARRAPARATAKALASAVSVIETATGATRVLHFRDQRPPHEIQFALERQLMALFTATMNQGKLSLQAQASIVGAQYSFELQFLATSPSENIYSLRVETSWAGKGSANDDYYRQTAGSWFSHWTRDLRPADPPPNDEGSTEQYQTQCDATLQAEQHLDTVSAIQNAILSAMKQGATFATSHKEGGSRIGWMNGRFAKVDYGDDPDHRNFASDGEFLNFLRQYYDHETSSAVFPHKVSEFVAWKLILRRLG